MLKKRIIPCLDIKDGQTVKGINFKELRYAGDPVALARKYADEGADELVFLDISATNEKRKTLAALVEKIAAAVNIPFTVGGGISTADDVSMLIQCGADKVSINTAAFNRLGLIAEVADRFGRQCVTVAVDIKKIGEEWFVFLNGGRKNTQVAAAEWIAEAEKQGAGEILLTSMNADGTGNGFAIEIVDRISRLVNIPVTASGGAGSMLHFLDLFQGTAASAALAASIFHYDLVPLAPLKKFLKENNIPVR